MSDVTLLERLEKLERENRRMKRLGAVGLLTLGGLLLMGQAKPKTKAPKVIQAQRFELVDAAGVTQGSFSLTEKGVALVLAPESSTHRVGLTWDTDGSGLVITDNGSPRLAALYQKGIGGMLGLAGDGGANVTMHAPSNEAPFLSLTGQNNKANVTMSVRDGAPSVYLTDRAGTVRASLDISELLGASLALSDYKGAPKLSLSVRADGRVATAP